jgi:photosystem II stability/assembly factor-like uncharacterized protein
MRSFSGILICFFMSLSLYAQHSILSPFANANDAIVSQQDSSNNIYWIKQHYLFNVLHNPNDVEAEEDNDNELARFNRWFHDVAVRTYPTGNLPSPGILLRETEKLNQKAKETTHKKTTFTSVWQPIGPVKVPTNFNGIGRVNCIIIDPMDTNILYVGTACGGVFISHDGGATWTSNSDNFPSLSIADIAVNPHHTDTIYAATGDGYGYENDSYSDFWGGLYSAGVMKSTDGGSTWSVTGLSYLQTNRDMIQKLLIHPNKPDILMAATRHGIFRSIDAGATWNSVYSGHIYSMAFMPTQPDTVYAISNLNLVVSYNAGATWQILYSGINPSNDRATIAVSPVTPRGIWILDANEQLHWSHDGGGSFFTTNPPDTAHFYGYYDRVLAVSPTDSTFILAFGSTMAYSSNAGTSWYRLNSSGNVHVDNHAAAINPLHPATIYTGNDGGISVTRNSGATWKNLGNGLMISQIYRMSSSQQNPNVMICGLQDNGTFTYNGTNWLEATGGDGEDCGINPINDNIQISSSQNGYFNVSFNQGLTFSHIHVTSETGNWTTPVAFDPHSDAVIYFGYNHIYATTDGASSFHTASSAALFPGGATALIVAPSTSNVIYAADFGHIFRTTDLGVTWINVTGNLPAGVSAITRIAVDYNDSMRVYVTTSCYNASDKVFTSGTGGITWTNISAGLPNLPVNCIAVDSSTPGALFIGNDLGVFYTDSAHTGWALYGTGLPNVIINDLDINYGNYKVRAATYGRGVWEIPLVKPQPSAVSQITGAKAASVHIYPNPTQNSWRIIFRNKRPATYTIKVTDAAGKLICTQQNADIIDASAFPAGAYNIEIAGDGAHYSIKAIRE